jgi:hypothetical protein
LWVYPTHFAAEGLGEQKIQVIKDRNMVVVMTAAIDWQKGAPLEDLLRDYIIPAARSDSPLSPDPAALEALQARVKSMADPVQPVPPLPDVARQIAGKTYVPESNPFGWESLTLNFEERSPEARVLVNRTSSDITMAVGLDNSYRETNTEGLQCWARGRWEDDSTFVIRQLQRYPELQETEYRLTFSSGELRIHAEEMVFGGSADVKATAK